MRFCRKELDGDNEIQGGKYGCALFCKLRGPPVLSGLSLGRICALVKMAIE